MKDEDKQELKKTVNRKNIILYESWLNNNQKGYEIVVQRLHS